MSQYIVSARKYRPDSFESLIGQDNIVQTLKNSVTRGQLAHAYLFCGPRGVGKTSAARIFAKTINCDSPGKDMEPCGHCESCKSFQEGRSYCIHEMDAASNNGVEDIKLLIEQVYIPPQVGKYSVYIVDEVHMLSKPAFNAFLKTLEEPPAHAIFILATTEKHKIPSTILSRCQTFDFNRIGIKDIVRNLSGIAQKEGIEIGDEALHVIAKKADGAMRDALTIFDQTIAFCGTKVKYEDIINNLNVLDFEYAFKLVDNFLVGDYVASLLIFNEILSKGFNALYFISALSSHLRDLMVSKSDGIKYLLELPDSLKKRYMEQASRCSISFIYEALSNTTLCESGYKTSVNPRLHIEFTLMKLCFILSHADNKITSKIENTPVVESKPVVKIPIVNKVESNSLPEAKDKEKPLSVEKNHQQELSIAQNIDMNKEDVAELQSLEREPKRGRRRSSKASSLLSISAIDVNSNKKDEASLADVATEDRIPDDEEIEKQWKEMAKEYESRPRLATAIEDAILDIILVDDIKQVTFFVANMAQKQWIEEKLLSVLQFNMRKRLVTGKLKLLVDLAPVENLPKKSFTPKEKTNALIEKNSETEKFIKELQLEVNIS